MTPVLGNPVLGNPVLGNTVRGRLAEAVLYLCTDARERQGDLERFLDRALGGGVDIVQLRQKGLEAGAELRYLETFRRACGKHGALLAVNDRADVAYAAGADVLHLGQDDLPVAVARQICGPDIVIGLSSHDEQQAAAAAARPEADYYCTGPVWPTPTKPGRPAPGLPLVRFAAGLSPVSPSPAGASPAGAGGARPWFAIGGIDLGNLGEVLNAGASRVVVVRAITEAEDPGAAAAALAARLRAA
jgi:thiamine-phosphate pyrophosphorylase